MTKRMFDNNIFITNNYIDNKELQTFFTANKGLPAYIEPKDTFEVVLEKVHAMFTFLFKFKPVDSHIKDYLTSANLMDEEIIYKIHNKPTYRDNSK